MLCEDVSSWKFVVAERVELWLISSNIRAPIDLTGAIIWVSLVYVSFEFHSRSDVDITMSRPCRKNTICTYICRFGSVDIRTVTIRLKVSLSWFPVEEPRI